MTKDVKKVLAVLAGYPVLWLFSALLHAADATMGGAEGLFSFSALASVSVVAALLFIPCLIAVIHFGTHGIKAYWAVVFGSALFIGALLTLGGSTATDFWGYAVSFGGITLLCMLFLMPGTLPGVLFLKSIK